MARTKKVQNEFNESNELEPIEVQVIDNSIKSAISTSEDQSNLHSAVFRRGGMGSVDTHYVIMQGVGKWLTKNAIEIVMRSQPNAIVLPEGSLFNVDVKNVPCKTCGK
jgi:hypothetical protein